ncbi:hypothetical protein OSB04_007480 [Centaurea solstitialis]|uniref:Uncharacterized protein n=1 Tax=Centaurea solstitialis TaxID=347529 RepID=A0AA38TJZ3_9ASTR|nr:hypothetical protein OSB04_007480 [Centaurea solstitialis]
MSAVATSGGLGLKTSCRSRIRGLEGGFAGNHGYFLEGKGESYRVRLRDSSSVNMGRPPKKGKKVVTEEDQETPDLREMIAAEVGEALHDMLPGYFA